MSGSSRRPPPLRSRLPRSRQSLSSSSASSTTTQSLYIETDSGNRISRQSSVKGSQYIVLGGKTLIDHRVVLRGDLHRPDTKSAIIAIGRYCVLEEGVSITPPGRAPPSASSSSATTDAAASASAAQVTPETGLVHIPSKVGSYVYMGPGTTSEAASIGSCVYIGAKCKIGKFTVIKECVVVEAGAEIAAYQVIPPFSRVAGAPARVVEELPESAEQVLELYARRVYAGIDVEAPFR